MFVYIALAAGFVFSLIFGIGEAKDKYNSFKDKSWSRFKKAGPTLKEFFTTFFGFLFIGYMAGIVIFGILFLFFGPGTPGNERIIAKTDTYTIAENSQFESGKQTLKFTAMSKNGYLDPVNIFSVDEIKFETKDPKTVIVSYEDQHHTWLAPWPLSTDTKVIVK